MRKITPIPIKEPEPQPVPIVESVPYEPEEDEQPEPQPEPKPRQAELKPEQPPAKNLEPELERLRQDLMDMREGLAKEVGTWRREQFEKLIKELQQTAKDITDTEEVMRELDSDIKKLEEWNKGEGHYEPSESKLSKYRNVLVNQVVPSLKGIIAAFSGIRNRMDVIQRLILKKGGEMEE